MEETIKVGEPFYVKATSIFNRGDIAVFDFYGNDYTSGPDENLHFKQHWEKRIYRIIALSGDVVQIKKDTVYVNGSPQAFPPGSKLPYEVYTRQPLMEEWLQKAELMLIDKPAEEMIIYTGFLSTNEVQEIKQKNAEVVKIVRNLSPQQIAADTAYAKTSDSLKWNTANYGPLKIPSPGDEIIVNDGNFKLYHNIPGIEKGRNKISEKLYFVMGDNRHMAEDSRFIGLISHSNIYGVVK